MALLVPSRFQSVLPGVSRSNAQSERLRSKASSVTSPPGLG